MLNNDEITNIRKSQIDGDMWEYTIKDIHGDYKPWTKCTITDEINPNAEYRKVEKWYVLEDDRYDNNFLLQNHKGDLIYNPIRFEGTKEECKKWIEEHTKKTWLEETFPLGLIIGDLHMEGEKERKGAIEVCKKILEELHNKDDKNVSYGFYRDMELELGKIIKDLGVEV